MINDCELPKNWEKYCDRCGFALASSQEEGCVSGDCSLRPARVLTMEGALRVELRRLLEILECNRCNAGHETLPLRLWDCPECVWLKMEALEKERDEAFAAGANDEFKNWQRALKEIKEKQDMTKCALKSSEEHVEYLRDRLTMLEKPFDITPPECPKHNLVILRHHDGKCPVCEIERKPEPKLPEDFMEQHLAEAKKSTMFGIALDELSREELMATIGLLGSDLQGERKAHLDSVEFFRRLGGK